jgi:hypothetical protein
MFHEIFFKILLKCYIFGGSGTKSVLGIRIRNYAMYDMLLWQGRKQFHLNVKRIQTAGEYCIRTDLSVVSISFTAVLAFFF